MSDYKPGDRVKVTRSWIGQVSPDGGFVRVEHGVGVELHIEAQTGTFFEQSVERLPDPEPDWRVGDVINAARHTLIRGVDERWRCTCSAGDEPSEWVTRRWDAGQVTILVRDGKPWRSS